jgi:phosphate transport system protein
MRVTLQEELDQLQASLLEEGELVLRALRGAINSLREGDPELADEVIAFDDEVDRLYLSIEQGIESLLARQTPVAVDLRFVLAVLHSNLHLERMADLCVTIAKLTKLAHGLPPEPTLIEGFDEMASRAEEMIRVALDSFVNRDVGGAESLVDLDELIDEQTAYLVTGEFREFTDASHPEGVERA